jgi:enamine deaminase RidA (YjgF/YER057c/UK114 family)
VAAGDACFVAGTTDAGPDGRSRHPGDIAAQAEAIFGIVAGALDEAGFSIADVVRTRMFVTDIGSSAEVLEVHRRWFGDVRPAASMVQVAALIDPSLLIEIEVDARR